MSSQISWKFPPNFGGENVGFNNGAIDHFSGHPLSSTVREVIQNSLDAERVDPAKPIGVAFNIHRLPKGEVLEATSLKVHLLACLEKARSQKVDKAVKYYERALERIDSDREVTFLAVHDYNSKGLTGPVHGDTGAWCALVKGTGISQKGSGSLGSFGHGSKAPFSLSFVRSLFYLSFVMQEDGSIEKRFQGKSILQTHEDPVDQVTTQGTGYYGHTANCTPLLDEWIPEWASRIRDDVDGQPGTTILIPYFSMGEDELPETAIAVIANFYYAIQSGNLEVKIHGETDLTGHNIRDKYWEYRGRLEDEKDGIDAERMKSNFESLVAVVDPTHNYKQQVPHLDSFTWYMKILDDDAEKTTRVAIARKEGMLIKHNPVRLERFQLTKSFEMFVCVDGKKGSELLKQVENPRHDDFEFDRLDLADRAEALKSYERLTNKIREVIKKYASLPREDSVLDDTLSDWFTKTSTNDSPGEGAERSDVVVVSRGSLFNRKSKSKQFKSDPSGDPTTVPGQGMRGGNGKRKTKIGPIPGPGGGIVSGPGKPSKETSKELVLEDLRVVPTQSPKEIKIIFDNPGSGSHELCLERVGEESRERVALIAPDGSSTDRISISLGEEDRQSLSLKSSEPLSGFKFEAKIFIEDDKEAVL